jgi:DNA-binding transcriptional MerR regulator/methylmalonyl-CoA mutase cobalamin-binding subunit
MAVLDEPVYRIGAVARRVGVSVHTLRVWERRYRAVTPQRTPGGDRLYSEADVERLARIERLVRSGHAVGTVARLPNDALERLSGPAAIDAGVPGAVPREAFLRAVQELDLEAVDRIVAQVSASLSPRQIALDFLTPVLVEVGNRWRAGTIGIRHEHFATSALRRLLSSVTRVMPAPTGGRVAVVATPSGERHELGALVVAMLARLHGWQVVYLGADLPESEIVAASRTSGAHLVLLSVTGDDSEPVAEAVAALERELPPGHELVVGGTGSGKLALTRARRLDTAQLEELLQTFR